METCSDKDLQEKDTNNDAENQNDRGAHAFLRDII